MVQCPGGWIFVFKYIFMKIKLKEKCRRPVDIKTSPGLAKWIQEYDYDQLELTPEAQGWLPTPKSINLVSYLKRLKDRITWSSPYMQKKDLDRLQHPFTLKVLKNPRAEGRCPSIEMPYMTNFQLTPWWCRVLQIPLIFLYSLRLELLLGLWAKVNNTSQSGSRLETAILLCIQPVCLTCS